MMRQSPAFRQLGLGSSDGAFKTSEEVAVPQITPI